MSNLTAVISADTTKFTKSINDAKNILQQYSREARNASGEIGRNTSVTDAQVASYQRVIKALDKVQSGTLSTAQSEKALANQLKELKVQWANLADSAKSSDFGKALSESLKSTEAQLKQVREQVKQTNEELKNLGEGSGGDFGLDKFKDVFNNIKTGNIQGLTGNLKELSAVNLSGVTSGMTGLVGEATLAVAPFAAIAASVAVFGKVCADVISSMNEFEVHLDNLQSLTGLDDASMKDISDGAIDMSIKFKASAGEIVDSMKLIGSQAPELLKNKDALMEVTEAANVLAEGAGISVEEAAKGITTVMNQMGASSAEATDIINVLAAASQQGAGDVSYLNTAFEKSGTAASSAGMSYTELAAAIETVAPKFSSADVAGSQLNSTLLALSTQTNDQFKPAVVGMQQALENLASAEMDDAEMKQLVGASNITMLKTLVDNRTQVDEYTKSLAGTSTAYDQMATNNDNLQGAMDGLNSAWEGFLLTLGQNEFFVTINDIIKDCIGLVTDLITEITEITNGVNQLDSYSASVLNIKVAWEAVKFSVSTTVGVIVGAIKGLIAILLTLKKWCEEVGEALYNSFKDTALFKTMSEWIEKVVGAVKKLYSWIKKLIGEYNEAVDTVIKGSKEKVEPIKIGVEVEDADVNVGGGKSGGGSNGGSSHKGGSKKGSSTTPKVEVKAEEGSLKKLEEDISKLNTDLKLATTDEDRKKIKAQIDELTKQKEGIELQLKPQVPEGSLKDIETKISNLQSELKLATSDDSRAEIKSQIDELTGQKKAIELVLNADDSLQKIQEKFDKVNEKKPASSFETAMGGDKNKDKLSSINDEMDANDALIAQYQELQKELEKTGNTGSELYETLTNSVEELTETQEGLAEQVRNISEEQERLNDLTKQYKDAADACDGISSMFNSLGSAIGGTEGQFFSMIGTMTQGIADIIPQILALIGAKEGEAMASGTASAAALPFPANLGAIASIIATVVATFASISSIMGSYADGGIISGANTIGDYNLARVNSGEMILNGTQQKRLFNILDGAGVQGTNFATSGDVNFKIKGKDLIGVISNYNKQISKVI